MLDARLDPYAVRRLVAVAFVLAACQDAAPNLSQTQQLAVVLSPSSYDFGSLQVGQTSLPASLDINPGAGDNYDTVSAITANCPDFIIDAPYLPADVYRTCDTYCDPQKTICQAQLTSFCSSSEYQTYSWSAQFKPTVAGTVSCPVYISLNGGATIRTVTLSGTGTAPPKDIDVQPTGIAFGDVRINTDSTPVSVTVRNLGGTAMTVSSVSLPAPFTIVSGPATPFPLAAGAQQVYALGCNPPDTSTYNGNFVVNSDDPTTPMVNVAISCRGTNSNVAIVPSPATLPATRVGEPVQTTIAISNSGAATMTLESVSVSGTDLTLMSAPPPGTYAQGAVGDAVVEFSASDNTQQDGTLTVTYDGGQVRTVAVNARALATSMALSPDGDVDFGPVCTGQTLQKTFTLLANNEGPFNVTELSAPTGEFTLTAPTLPFAVLGNGATSLGFDVTAAPTTEGRQTSTVSLTTDIPGSSPRQINMSVDALPPGVSPSPPAIDFGSTPLMTTTIGQQVHLSNCSDAPIGWSNARLEGVDAGEFAIVAQPDGMTIAATDSIAWLVVLTTKSVGVKHAEFVVDHDGGTARVPLDGEALADNLGSDAADDITRSYYTCSTGSGSGSWPFAIALLVLGLRRRRRS